MFAGAAREAVFSNPDVIRRVNAEFVPVALKAALVNNPGDDEEGRLYREIGRSKAAPQGICVANSAGKVLDWALMFDNDASVLAFLDRTLQRFRQYPDAKQAVAAERYMRFPSERLPDIDDTGKTLPAPDRHSPGQSCPADPPLRKGTAIARLIGRALDKDGKPAAEVVRQEQYVEDLFHVPPDMQFRIVQVLARAGTESVALPDEFSKLCATHAHLGHIDVRPVLGFGQDISNRGQWKQCEFRAGKINTTTETSLWRVEGESEVVSELAINGQGVHNVQLTWDGLIEVRGTQMTQLLLAARGKEKLEFAKVHHPLKQSKADEVACLSAGRPIDVECGVRYGIVGEPVADENTLAAGTDPPSGPGIPEEARRQLIGALGTPLAVIFRDKVQQELKLSDHQQQKLAVRLHELVHATMQIFQEIEGLKAEERERKFGPYRQQAQQKLSQFLSEILETQQFTRLREVALQQEGWLALGRPEVMNELNFSDNQRQQFVTIVEELQQKIRPLVSEAQSGGNPQEIGPKVLRIRKDYEAKIETILNDSQKKQWQEMLGKPFDLES